MLAEDSEGVKDKAAVGDKARPALPLGQPLGESRVATALGWGYRELDEAIG